MTTSDLERRLTALLQQHAEDTMNSTNTEERLRMLLEETEQDTRRRRRRWMGGALVAAAAAGAIIVWASGVGDDPETGSTPDVATATAEDVALATAFLDAYGSWDRGAAVSYLSDSAYVEDSLRPGWMRWSEAIGFTMLVDSCEARGGSAEVTLVRCAFDYHALGSDELGLGPYSDNAFSISVRDGEIVSAHQELGFSYNGFSEQMWEPFAAWVSRTYPKDAAVMYADWPSTSLESHSARSIELWRQHTREYVREQSSE